MVSALAEIADVTMVFRKEKQTVSRKPAQLPSSSRLAPEEPVELSQPRNASMV